MKRMHWSWRDYSDLPVSYLGPLLEIFKKEEQEAKRSARSASRGRR
jgi:hypothetical protein